MKKSWRLSRRTVLRGLGATIALPFLDAMTPLARAARRNMKPPVRLMWHWVGTATNMADWFPQEEGPDYTLSPALQPLERHRRHFSVVTGTRNFTHLDYGNQGVVGGHGSGLCWLTSQFDKVGSGVYDIATHSSVDQIAARHLGNETRHPSLQLGSYSSTFHVLSWTERGTPLPTITGPGKLFSQLFTERTAKEREAYRRNLMQNKSLLDLVQGSRQDLQRRLGNEDQEKLDQYLTSIRELEKGFTRDELWLDTPLPVLNVKEPAPSAEKNKEQWQREMFRLITLAFSADMTRVVALAGDGPGDYNSFLPGVTEAWHPISHHNRDPNKLAQMTKINQWNARMHGEFIDMLSKSKESDGSSLLDNSLILTGDSMTDGQHWGGNYPLLLTGHGGGLRQGRHLKFCTPPNYNQDKWPLAEIPTSNVYLSMLKAAGAPVEKFADSTGTLSGLS
ncbi:DUF1552 domain-containing protein [Lignipirellula cremea]|uniref:DUF1552 domain-containing protein n=1 Tax=Lignipirellula cremea TaxID=2528010 RepID=A0A518DVF0_9BACT|nr:DUF1552 domain-containing protein [Lignipirellula cremea]QDU95816.1 hypothetical protein Pla8534_36330 [Lignipirellula cremea]